MTKFTTNKKKIKKKENGDKRGELNPRWSPFVFPVLHM